MNIYSVSEIYEILKSQPKGYKMYCFVRGKEVEM